VGIGPSGAFVSRRSAHQCGVRSTDGNHHRVAGGTRDATAGPLFVPKTRQDPSQAAWPDLNGNRVHDNHIGFSAWSDSANGGNIGRYDLTNAPVNHGSWNSLPINFARSECEYIVNGVDVLDIAAASGTANFSSVVMQGFNLSDDPNSPGGVGNSCMAYWANRPVPQSAFSLTEIALCYFIEQIHRIPDRFAMPVKPDLLWLGSLALLGNGRLGPGFVVRRRRPVATGRAGRLTA
jgi:hypothetical protein